MRTRILTVLALASATLTACADDAPNDAADTGVDSADVGTDAEADAEPAVCEHGIDENNDGVCDREVADWSRNATLPESGQRTDIYQVGDALPDVASRGIAHAFTWPVSVSGVLLPWAPIERMLDPDTEDASVRTLQGLARNGLGFGTVDEMYEWLGLAYHDGSPEAWDGVAWPDNVTEGDPLGAGVFALESGDEVLSFSCATCHSADLFGQTVVGLTNRQAQANEFFNAAATFFPALTPQFFEDTLNATDAEIELFVRTQRNLEIIGVKVPEVRGLDTSLAQVSLSLARRAEDEWATPDPAVARNPRENLLDDFVSDSKPAVWWNMRYKTRWLSDGSIVSGNPVFTNFLWNELGRGTDLHELLGWLEENEHIVDELTVAVFATQAPRWEAWFGADSIDLAAAQRGQELFNGTCSECHGVYEKGWERDDADSLLPAELLANTRLYYHDQTPVLDVGTDLQRADGMVAFADRLNELTISQWMETVVEVQPGYVPPPLDGIWARYPYLHNQSVPTLCDMLTPAAERTTEFWMGPSANADTDYDMDCVGYPTGDAVPESWREDDHNHYDTTLEGLGNFGHDEWLTDDDGQPVFSAADRADLIMFLKTL